MKKCSFCNKEVPRLWYSKPACCANGACRKKYNDNKGKPTPKIKQFSDKRMSDMKRYRPLRDKYMADHPICEARVEGVCSHKSVDLHHTRSREFFLCDVKVFMAVCRACHNWIDENDAEARQRGFLKSKHGKD